MLSLLLRARHDDGSPMGDVELRDELLTVVGAGHETTATALAWAMERLLRTPRVLARLRESVAAGEDDYLDATVKETLRVRPVIVDVARRLTAPVEIAGYKLPAGSFVLPAIGAVHFREDVFPDPDQFRPERFLDGKAENYAWIPFGGGVRRCVGAAFAEYEMRIVLREFVERAELSAPGPRARAGADPQHHPRPRQGHAGGAGASAGLAGGGLRLGRRLRLLPLRVELFDGASWRPVTLACPLGAARARPGGGIGQLLLDLPQLRLGALDPLLQPSRFARRLSATVWRDPRLRAPLEPTGFAAATVAEACSSRRRWYSAQPLGWLRSLPLLADQGATADGLQQGAVVGDEDDRALELDQRVLERLAALDVEVVGGLVEDQHVGARGDQDRQREPPLLAAGDVAELLLDVGAGEEEAAEQRPRLLAGEAGLALGGVEHGALTGGACRRAGRGSRA